MRDMYERVTGKTDGNDVALELQQQDDSVNVIVDFSNADRDPVVDKYSGIDEAKDVYKQCLDQLDEVNPELDRLGLIEGYDDSVTALGTMRNTDTQSEKDTPTVDNQPDGVEIRKNQQKSGVEIKFEDKPPATIRNKLKNNGWRWSNRNALWYHKQNGGSNLKFAKKIAKEYAEVDPADLDPRDLLRQAADKLDGDLGTKIEGYLEATE